MKINLDAVLKQLTGEPLKDEVGKDLTLGVVCTTALVNDSSGDGAAKTTRYRLALETVKGGVQEFSVEDVAVLKNCVGTVIASTIHAGQARLMLDKGE